MKYTCNDCKKTVSEKKAIEWKHVWSTLHFCSEKCKDKVVNRVVRFENFVRYVVVGCMLAMFVFVLYAISTLY